MSSDRHAAGKPDRNSPAVAATEPTTPGVEISDGPARSGLIDSQGPVLEITVIQRRDRSFGFRLTRHIDQAKPARLAGSSFDLDFRHGHRAERFEQRPQLLRCGRVIQIPDINHHSGHQLLIETSGMADFSSRSLAILDLRSDRTTPFRSALANALGFTPKPRPFTSLQEEERSEDV
jgi:hypothetical protein